MNGHMNGVARAVAAALLPPRPSRRELPRLRGHLPRLRGHSTRRVALLITMLLLGAQAILGAPAVAQIPGVDDCKEAPNPERPGSGMVGVFDATPPNHGTEGSIYRDFGYAGQVWHNYDLGCGPSGLRNPNAVVDTWTGNQLFNIGKNLVAATNGLHYELLDGQLLKPVDDLVMTGTTALYDSVFAPLFALVAIVLAVLLFRSIWRGDLATIGKRGMWALAALWFASITYLTPLIYAQALDAVLIDGTSAVQSGFFRQVGVEERDELPTMLHETVVYQNWLRGEFGSPQSPDAQKYGNDLVHAQAWTKAEMAAGAPPADEKRAAFKALADGQICPADGSGSSCGYFQGKDGSRMGAGFLAAGQGIALALFQLLAKAAILLAQVLLRVLILMGPIIGLVALVYHDVLRNVGKAIGAAVINVVVVAALAGLHAFILTSLFDPARGLPPLAQLLLATLITVIFLLICKPIRRMWQMVELSVGAVSGVAPGSPQGVLARLRRRKEQEPTPQDEFWSQVRDLDTAEPAPRPGEHRVRPEAAPAVVAVAERLDRRPALPSGGRGSQVVVSSGTPAPALSGPAYEQPALPAGTGAGAGAEGRSRTVDAPPVVDTSWDRLPESEPVLVPSQAGTGSTPPRRAELETVDGRSVWVVYRPSQGFEVRPM